MKTEEIKDLFKKFEGIKAKDLAAEMTSINVQQKDLYGQNSIETEHVDDNLAVRDVLVSRGIYPEQLPAGRM